MNNIIMSQWDVVLYFRTSAHSFIVLAQDEEAAIKEALSIYNQERSSVFSITQLVDFDVTRIVEKDIEQSKPPRIYPGFQPPLS